GRRKLLAGNQRQRKVVSALQPGARGAREERPGHGEVRSSKFHEWREEPCANEATASAHGIESDRRKRLRQSNQQAEAGHQQNPYDLDRLSQAYQGKDDA